MKAAKPRLRLTDPAFVYYNSADTDLRRTFERVREQMKLDDAKTARGLKAIPIRRKS